MLGYNDSVRFGYVGDGVFGQWSEPFVLRQRVEQNAFLHFAQEMHSVEDIAEEVVDLNAHRRVEVVEVGGGQHLLRVAYLNAQCRELHLPDVTRWHTKAQQSSERESSRRSVGSNGSNIKES